jgi:hypothetical protein
LIAILIFPSGCDLLKNFAFGSRLGATKFTQGPRIARRDKALLSAEIAAMAEKLMAHIDSGKLSKRFDNAINSTTPELKNHSRW